MHPRATILLGAALLPIALVPGVQIFAGAYRGDFSADNDEAAQAVSSLLVRDYVVHGFPANPLRYAEAYYVHYPKVAIGRWPPLFYAGEAAWMRVFGRTRVAMVAFLAALAVALLSSVFLWVRRDCGTVAGPVSAIALAAPQFMRYSITTIAPNVALALLAFWAAVLLGEYLDRGRRRDAILFAILALDAIAVHWRGVAVACLPAGLLFTGRFAWTRLRAAILIAMAAIVLVVPWRLAQASPPRILDILRDAGAYLYGCFQAMSWPIFLLACVGAFVVIRRTATPRRWLAMPALALSGWIFHSLVNAGWADRYLVTGAPAIAALAGAGYSFCANSRMARCACLVIIAAGLTWITLPVLAILSTALAGDPARWRPAHFEGQPPGVTAFERAAPLPPGIPEIRLDLRYTLRKTIELQP